MKNLKIIPYIQYVQKLCKRFRKIEFRHTPKIQKELADALDTISSMIKHLDTDHINPLDIKLKEHPVIVPMLKQKQTVCLGILI